MMQVILMVYVPKLGKMGDVVRVAPGYGRNYLIPQGKAKLATKEAIKEFEARRADLESHQAEQKKSAEEQAKTLDGLALTMVRQAGESKHLYGSVTAKDVAQGIELETKLSLPRSSVTLEHPIKELGVFKAYVTLHPEVVVTVLVNVAQTDAEAASQLAQFQNPSAS